MAPPPGRVGGTVTLPVHVRMFPAEIAAVAAFAAAFSRAEALRIAAMHIPSNLVVAHGTSDGESSSHRDILLLHDVWTTSNRLSSHKILT